MNKGSLNTITISHELTWKMLDRTGMKESITVTFCVKCFP